MTQHINNLKENYTSVVESAREKSSQPIPKAIASRHWYKNLLVNFKEFLEQAQISYYSSWFHLNKLMTDFQEKATLFNNFFASRLRLTDGAVLLYT